MSGGGSSVDLDVITAEAGDILAGKTGIDPEGEPLPGTLALTGNAQPQYVLEGQTFYSTDPKTIQNGSMPHLSNNTPVDFASGNTTPVIVCDAHFYDTNTDGVARMCFRYNGEAGYIVPNTLFGYPFSVNSILSFSVAVISGRRVTATWQSPIQAAGRPYSGVYIKYSTSGYPGTGGTQIYKGVGSNAASGGISTATFDLPNVGTRYYLSIYPYVTTSAGELLGGVLNAQVTTGNTITNTYTSSTTVSVPTGYTLADIFCVGGGGGGSNGRSASRDHYGGGGGAGGPILVGVEQVLGQDAVVVPCQAGQEGRAGLLQGDDEGVVIGALHGVHHGQIAGQIAVLLNDLFVGELHIRGGEGLAVVPLHALAQVEGVGEVVLRDLPALGQIGDDLFVVVQRQQAAVEVAGHVIGIVVGVGVRVEAGGVAAKADQQHLLPARFGRAGAGRAGAGRAAAAGRQAQRHDRGHQH